VVGQALASVVEGEGDEATGGVAVYGADGGSMGSDGLLTYLGAGFSAGGFCGVDSGCDTGCLGCGAGGGGGGVYPFLPISGFTGGRGGTYPS